MKGYIRRCRQAPLLPYYGVDGAAHFSNAAEALIRRIRIGTELFGWAPAPPRPVWRPLSLELGRAFAFLPMQRYPGALLGSDVDSSPRLAGEVIHLVFSVSFGPCHIDRHNVGQVNRLMLQSLSRVVRSYLACVCLNKQKCLYEHSSQLHTVCCKKYRENTLSLFLTDQEKRSKVFANLLSDWCTTFALRRTVAVYTLITRRSSFVFDRLPYLECWHLGHEACLTNSLTSPAVFPLYALWRHNISQAWQCQLLLCRATQIRICTHVYIPYPTCTITILLGGGSHGRTSCLEPLSPASGGLLLPL